MCSSICIRHVIPKLLQETYLPIMVLEKINADSFHGFVNYANQYLINKYECVCLIPNCYICNRRNAIYVYNLIVHEVHVRQYIKKAIMAHTKN